MGKKMKNEIRSHSSRLRQQEKDTDEIDEGNTVQ